MTEMQDTPFVHRRWRIDVATVGQGKSGRLDASAQECLAAAAALDLLDCHDLRLDFNIKPMAGGRFRLNCKLACDVVQASIVSLEPVPAKIDEHTESELVPEGRPLPEPPDGAVDILNAPIIETYANGQIDLGHLAFELLSVSIEPYPKKEGESLPEPGEATVKELSPFAALAALRKAQDGG